MFVFMGYTKQIKFMLFLPVSIPVTVKALLSSQGFWDNINISPIAHDDVL